MTAPSLQATRARTTSFGWWYGALLMLCLSAFGVVVVMCIDRLDAITENAESVADSLILPAAEAPEPTRSIRAVSFNVRVSLKEDGDNRWSERRDLAIETLRNLQADFIGLQEAFGDQRAAFTRGLEDFVEIDGNPDRTDFSNLNPILIRESRFSIVRQGTFWLSETPSKPLSVSWGSKIPRACTWVVAREVSTERELVIMNAHLQSGVALAREQSAELIIERLQEFTGIEQVLLGDLNSRLGTPPLVTLMQAGLVDCFGKVHPEAENVRTYHAFLGETSGPHRTDFVLSSVGWTVLDAGIDHSEEDGRYPSDHFPVWADIRW